MLGLAHHVELDVRARQPVGVGGEQVDIARAEELHAEWVEVGAVGEDGQKGGRREPHASSGAHLGRAERAANSGQRHGSGGGSAVHSRGTTHGKIAYVRRPRLCRSASERVLKTRVVLIY